ncbi:TolC family protein [Alienimonas californiensis]|uniref:Cation efflux system protein CusC n=1 Tax=Alienimonas californiensis TaxID=2527989 RepID=A0A517PAK1_9PLAN|nr:TolC family protein [Alienimonas californiensis]QDT16396.1 Cation efflux system protein CusC precursor [Alienimonas californiensis]
MNSRPLESSFAKAPHSRVRLGVLCLGALLLTPGCGIPEKRGPMAGPPLPHHFHLNNGLMPRIPTAADLLGTESDPADVPPAPTGEEADESAAPDRMAEIDDASFTDADSFATPVFDGPGPIELMSLSQASSPVPMQDAEGPNEPNALVEGEPETAETDDPRESPVNPDEATYGYDGTGGVPTLGAPQSSLPAPAPLPVPPEGTVGMWGDATPGAGPCPGAAQIPLTAFFNDPNLVNLIYQALAGNQELRILAEQVNMERNEAYARSGEYRPFVSLDAGAELEKASRFTREGAVEEELTAAPGRGFPDPLPNFLVATNVSWELDIWRRLRNAQDAAAMRFLASQEGRTYVVTRLAAEIAENYYELLALDNRLETLRKTIEIQQQSLVTAEAKKEAGRGTELAVQRFQAEVRKNQSEILILQQDIVEAENRINLLVGRYPQPVERTSVDYLDLNLETLGAGLPAELLRNRGDIRQAEREIAAAGLDLEVARARFYPSLGLRAGVGLQAFNSRYVFSTPESLIYNAALDLAAPLINKRAIQAEYRNANSRQLQSVYEYQQTVLTAHMEVVNYLSKVENYRQSIEVKKRQLEALQASVDTANQLFQNARAEYVEVLLAQRELMEARMLLIETKREQLTAVVNAYQALGGGGF